MKHFFFIILLFFSCYKDKFLFNQNNFVFNKKHFYDIYFFSFKKNIFLLYEFFIHYFSGEHIWSSICIYKSQNFSFSTQTEQHHGGAKQLERGILECCVVKAK